MPIVWNENMDKKCKRTKDGKHWVTTDIDEVTLYCDMCDCFLGEVRE